MKGIVASAVAIPLAVVAGAHALSSASVRNAPELAVAIWPANGAALEKLAYRSFVEDVRSTLNTPGGQEGADDLSGDELNKQISVGQGDLQRFASDAASAAREALRYEPLSSKAHAVLALSEPDPSRQRRIIELASSLNRRELALQGLVLQSKIDAQDYAGTMETLDQILRVYPQRRAEFYPYLTAALSEEATIPAFRKLLADPLPWRDSFLMHALRDPAATRNLGVIRQSIALDNAEFDRALIATLVRNGELGAAATLYGKFASARGRTARSGWAADFPPFDWAFADEPGLRAQLAKGGDTLEFTIDSGNGGALASRLLALPDAPFTIVVKHEVGPNSSVKDLKLLLACPGQASPFFEASFADSNGTFVVSQRPRCTYVNLVLSGRAWTDGDALEGTITSVTVKPG
ncbi:hypothetical protein CHX26_09165 [Porphyrobacter sp. HT-58-2]|uniref:hypothetical protein n=1 Tax=Porphyrobacter sp. HT-58-2 TaxID=2023229 RepID=UPI000CDC1A2F|nr:hypothetical protein [Porphyrobacter sp. HT-58-2]AUX69641.1 hypothetical protein CHX26_09165 [Porphyrobacter sp. HT-58-2]